MDIFTYMDKNSTVTFSIALFICISTCVAFVQIGEALKVLFSRINAGNANKTDNTEAQ